MYLFKGSKAINPFIPILWDCFKRGCYNFEKFRHDIGAGLSVGVISLPLAVTFSNACHVSPESGIFATVIGGFIASFLGGTRFLITGPTAIFLLTCLELIGNFGIESLFLATLMAGIILAIAGFLRVGAVIDFIPYSVILGFMTGLSFVIFTVQIKDCLGLSFSSGADNSANQVINHWIYYWNNLSLIHWPTVIMSLFTAIPIFLLKKYSSKFPFFVLVLIASSLIVYFFQIDLLTIGKKYGDIAEVLPNPRFPLWSIQQILTLIPYALTLAFLSGINALLSSAITHEMTNKAHKPNMELIAQGFANIGSSVFGGLPVAATMTRTVTNIKAHGRTPVSGMFACVFVFLAIKFSANLIKHIPIPCLSAVLLTIAYDMIRLDRFVKYLSIPHGERIIVLTTFTLTIFVDVAVAILSGIVLASLLFMRRMGDITVIKPEILAVGPSEEIPEEITIYHIDGPFFFGAASRLKNIFEENKPNEKVAILNLKNMPMIDSTGSFVLKQFIKNCNKRKVKIILANINPLAEDFFQKVGLDKKNRYQVAKNLKEAIDKASKYLKKEKV